MNLDMSLTPQEMAKALTDEMGTKTIDGSCYHCTDGGNFTGDMKRHRGRKCAIVAVHNTINSFMYFCADNPETDGERSFIDYWKEVKKILEDEQ